MNEVEDPNHSGPCPSDCPGHVRAGPRRGDAVLVWFGASGEVTRSERILRGEERS